MSSIDTKFPVALPETTELHLGDPDFRVCIHNAALPAGHHAAEVVAADSDRPERDEESTLISEEATSISGFSDLAVEANDEDSHPQDKPDPATNTSEHPFVAGLKTFTPASEAPPNLDNKMLTENADIAHSSTKDPLVDLFFELEEVLSSARLRELLGRAWTHDNLATLKIIFNARSIHLGKASRPTFYRCCGWLVEHHPKTLLLCLQWLAVPTIQKPRSDQADSKSAANTSSHKVSAGEQLMSINNDAVVAAEYESHLEEQGLAHGYWKDLLNLLALAVHGEFTSSCDPSKVLNIKREGPKRDIDWDRGSAKAARDVRRIARHENAAKMIATNATYRLLHTLVARLFASQLSKDMNLLAGEKKGWKRVSLAAKWAPTLAGFHDQHTLIASSIAELLFPKTNYEAAISAERAVYVKHAREDYRRLIISPLRKALELVEREVTAKTYGNINYGKVPSLAMNRYSPLFIAHDFDRFDKYIDSVTKGEANIAGATLLPSTLVHAARSIHSYPALGSPSKTKTRSALVVGKEAELRAKVLNGQWNTLCQRIRDSGTLESSIAVCDVSGSMGGPIFKDGTCPMDSAIGLSLLLAEVTKKPFGGHFVTFSTNPVLQEVGGLEDQRSLQEKIEFVASSHWGMNTDFVAVFERLVLPMAVQNNLSQADTVKQVFVFSDMQFDCARVGEGRWTTSYERLKKMFSEAGYELPKLIFWNLAGGRAGYLSDGEGDPNAPKPVTADEEGTALVSGYSQGQLKVFLEGSGFEDPEDEIEEAEEMDSEGETIVRVSKKQKVDPLTTVRKAISHKAYSMLEVVD